MRPRTVVTILLSALAVTAAGLLAAETAITGSPGLVTILATALLAGTAAAWPVASRGRGQDAPGHRRPMVAPACGECGHASWLSPEFGFCIQCGSHRVWSFVAPR